MQNIGALKAAQAWLAARGGAFFWLAVAALVIYVNALFWVYTEYRVGVTGDSGGYLGWYPLRGPGYSAFLHLLHWLLGDLRYLGVLQLNLLLLSFGALAYGFGRLTASRWAALALLLLLCMLMPLMLMSAWIANEAVFGALVCFHLAALCCHLRRPSILALVCIGTTIALIYILRPAGLPFAATALALLWFTPLPENTGPGEGKGRGLAMSRTGILASLGLPVLAGLLLLGAINQAAHGRFSVRLQGGVFLLGHVAQLIRAEDGKGTQHERLLRELATELEPYRQKLAAADRPKDYWRLTSHKSEIIWGTLFPKLGPGAGHGPALARFEAMSAAATELSFITIAAHPWEYLRHVAAHYLAAWKHAFVERRVDFPENAAYRHALTQQQLADDKHRPFFAEYMDTGHFFDDQALARYQAMQGETTLIGRSWAFLVDNRSALLNLALLLCLLSWALLLAPRHRRDPLLQFCAHTAFLLHANVLFIAAIHPTLNRYTLPLLPLLALLLASAAALAPRLRLRRRPTQSHLD